jgi:hypothetical protein
MSYLWMIDGIIIYVIRIRLFQMHPLGKQKEKRGSGRIPIISNVPAGRIQKAKTGNPWAT